MTVYVDEIRDYGPGRNKGEWSHLWSDDPTNQELHQMAVAIGLKYHWFQPRRGFPHYDVRPNKRSLALKKGAVFMPLKEWLQQSQPQKEKE